MTGMDPAARFVGSEIYRHSSYGGKHPLSIPRVSTCIDLSRALGWLPESHYIDSPRATAEQLARFHDPAYVAAVQAAEARQRVSDEVRERFGLGANGNPVFPEMFCRPATSCGGSILAAKLVASGTSCYSPGGGTHHGLRDRASGFCYFNDAVLAILTLLDEGVERVFYLDVDAHHGDGVQIALEAEPRVFTCSIHEAGRWPMRPGGRGELQDRGGGNARNLPVPEGFNDSELALLMDEAVLPLIARFKPKAIVLQCGADGLEEDPLSKLCLSNRALWSVVASMRASTGKLLVLGGGGYNPWTVARAWVGVWGTLSGHAIPKRLPVSAEAILRSLSWRHSRGRNPPEEWFTALADKPREGPLRQCVRDIARDVLR